MGCIVYLKTATGHLNGIAMGVWVLGNEDFGGSIGVGAQAKPKFPGLEVKPYPGGPPGDFAGPGPDQSLQGSTAGIDILRVCLLVSAEDGKVFAIPAVTMLIAVICGVIPQSVVEKVGVQGPNQAVHGLDLDSKVSGLVRFFVFHIIGNASLAN